MAGLRCGFRDANKMELPRCNEMRLSRPVLRNAAFQGAGVAGVFRPVRCVPSTAKAGGEKADERSLRQALAFIVDHEGANPLLAAALRADPV
jgi:hypothetical protein